MGKEIMIRDLTFSYGGDGKQLGHISFDIAAGGGIVLTGPSAVSFSHLTLPPERGVEGDGGGGGV